MSRVTKGWLIAAAILVVTGVILAVGAIYFLDVSLNSFSTAEYETKTFDVNEDFDKLDIDEAIADVSLVPSEDGKCKVVCYEPKEIKRTVEVQDGTLKVETKEKNWSMGFGINTESPKMTVYLPKEEYTSLVINNDTGDAEVPQDFTFGNVTLSSDTGDVTFRAAVSDLLKIVSDTGEIRVAGIRAGKIDIKAATGDVTLEKVITEGAWDIRTDTGEVTFSGSDAAEIFIATDTGDVKGTLLTGKIFLVENDAGDTDVPKTTTGGRCEITTDTGDVEISIAQ